MRAERAVDGAVVAGKRDRHQGRDLELAGEELPDPVGTEFKLLYDLQMFGQPLPDALKAFAARIPLKDVAPGLYVIRVEAQTRLGDRPVAARETVIRVSRPEPAQ